MSLSYLKDNYLLDNKGILFKVKYVRKFSYKKSFPKVDIHLVNVKTLEEIKLYAMDYADFAMSFRRPDPFVMEVLYGPSNKEVKKDTTKT